VSGRRYALARGTAATCSYANKVTIYNCRISHAAGIASRANERIDTLERKVVSVVTEMQATLNAFYSEYQEENTLRKANEELSAAEREWEQKFGRFKEVREIAANIIDIVGSGFIGVQALTDATERHALRTPRYWLAPASLAVAALLSAQKDVYHSSIDSALRLDRSKAALFMALLLRHQERGKIVEERVDVFLSGLDPTDLPRDFQVVIDAVTSNALGPDSAPRLTSQLNEWYQDAGRSREAEAKAVDEWKRRLLSLAATHDYAKDFPFLAQASPDWPGLSERHTVNTAIERAAEHFPRRFADGADVSSDLGTKIGVLLRSLAETPDPAEEECLRKIRGAKAVIETRNRDAAKRRMDSEDADRAGLLNIESMMSTAAFPKPEEGRLPPPTPTELLAIMLSKRLISTAAQRLGADLPPLDEVQVTIDLGRWKWDGAFSCTAGVAAPAAQASAHVARLRAELEEQAQNQRRRFKRAATWTGLGAGLPVTGLVIAALTASTATAAELGTVAALIFAGGLGVLSRFAGPLLVRFGNAGGDPVEDAEKQLDGIAGDLERFLAQDRHSRELLPQLRKYLQDLRLSHVSAATRRVAETELPWSRSLPEWTPRPPRRPGLAQGADSPPGLSAGQPPAVPPAAGLAEGPADGPSAASETDGPDPDEA
jgi:hypothetical protein